MENIVPTAAFKPEATEENQEDHDFDFEKYRYDLAQTIRSIRNGDPEKLFAGRIVRTGVAAIGRTGDH